MLIVGAFIKLFLSRQLLGGGKGQLKVVVLYGWRKRRERQHYDRNYEIILNFNNFLNR